MDLRDHIRVGDKLYGYCNGYFGRDSYGEKTVEAVGPDFIVCRECTCVCADPYVSADVPVVAVFWPRDWQNLCETELAKMVKEWKEES